MIANYLGFLSTFATCASCYSVQKHRQSATVTVQNFILHILIIHTSINTLNLHTWQCILWLHGLLIRRMDHRSKANHICMSALTIQYI